MDNRVLRNIGKMIIKYEYALIEITGISIHFSNLTKTMAFKTADMKQKCD